MFRALYPKKEYKSAYHVPYERYYEKGYRGILFDVDNTLVEHDQPATKRAKELFQRLHELGFQTCVISNNKEHRVQPFADKIHAFYVHKAGKPLAGGYIRGMERMGTKPDTTIFVGDQIFTDIWGANRAGIHSILVGRLAKHEEIQIILKRRLEWIVLWTYHHRRKKRRKQK